jgi:ABC-2 type transport system permease protein
MPSSWVEPPAPNRLAVLFSRIGTFCIVEMQKLSHDLTEIFTRAVQPILWLAIFGTTFSRIRAIPTGGVPYLAYLAPGIIAQSALFVAIFYGIQIIWERDSGILAKLLATPTPRVALVAGKAFAAGIRSCAIAIVVMLVAFIMQVRLTLNPLHWLAMLAVVMLGAAFFSCLSLIIAGLVLKRDRLMGFGQAITMPLFFASNALYPVAIMPGWVRAVAQANPLSYEVSALRGLLVGTPTNLALDVSVLLGAVVIAVSLAGGLLGRLSR